MHPAHTHTRTLNIGILAHVDAGKTSLTERLLYDTGAIDRLGSVDAGSTQTDTDAIERQRGITVRSAVASFRVGDTQVNLIDTPGHSDFIAEVERALGVLDGAVLVLSAVEGVQAQTRVLMRTLREIRLPTLVFVNKIDRAGARADDLLADIRRKLAPHIAPMTAVRDLGTRSAKTSPHTYENAQFRATIGELLADHDDAILARVVDGPPPTPAELAKALADQTARGLVHPVYFGSAISGQGIDALVGAITTLLPSPAPDLAAPPRGTVFAVKRDESGHKTAYLRLTEGAVMNRQKLTFASPDGTHTGRLTSLDVVGADATSAAARLTAGNIGRLRGLPRIRVGDHLGPPQSPAAQRFAAPTLQSVVRPREPGTAADARLHAALLELAEQDPLIRTRTEPGGATSVLLYGEVQKEVIAATLLDGYGIEAVFEPSRTVYTERPTGVGESAEEIHRGPAPSGYWATVGLRVEPAPHGTGNTFRYETELGALPRAFHQAVEETVLDALRSGGPHGWAVTDCTVTLVRSGFNSVMSTAGDFRALTRIVVDRALRNAGSQVYEPYHAFELEIPLSTLAAVGGRLTALGALIEETTGGDSVWLLRGTVAARRVAELERWLPGLTHGEGVWWSRPAADRPLDHSDRPYKAQRLA
ncbi:tetracycline resistance ribosomal protection protein Otr(A) [Streptomyces sp. NPDC050485]|uniref:tetracycline resistance ribosomal protection protein Otr(A) n=1 Tax=Streptomyces sp. NPDC050485 TaxID=3365617 RepID=UPI00379E88BF